MPLQHVLALTDFSTTGEQALERAAQVAASHGASLRLLYAADRHDSKFSDPHARLDQRARQLARRHGLQVRAVHGSGDALNDLDSLLRSTDLLVVDAARQRSLRGFWRGATVAQLVRRHGCPVLVVKQAVAAGYRQVLVAVDLSRRSRALVGYAGAFEREAPLELFHALQSHGERHLRAADVPLETLQSYRQAMTRQAHDRLLRLSTSFDTRRNRYRLAVNRGDPAYQASVQQQVSQADLMVVGKGRRHALLDGWWPSLAWRLVGLAGCDVLVVPDHHRTPNQPQPLPAFAENGSLG